MRQKSVSIEDIDSLYSQITVSVLYRKSLREEMESRGVDSHELQSALEQTPEQGYDFGDIRDRIDRYADLEQRIANQARADS